MHLLAIATLYTSAISFLVMIFQYVNVLLPDPLASDGFYNLTTAYSRIRWSISSMVIVFPVYILTTWYLNKSYAAAPPKSNLLIRKWLIYFTLFAAALIIIGDLVTLVYNLLGGELTLRFILKVLSVFYVAISVFMYYFWELKKYRTE